MLVLVTRVIIKRSKSKPSPFPAGFSELPGPTLVSTGQKTRPGWGPGFCCPPSPWSLPNDEIRVGLLHDELLRANVLLLSRVHYVPLFQDLHGKGFVFVALELNLQSSRNKERWQPVVSFFPFSFPAESINAGVTPRRPLPARHGQSLQPPECRWCWSRPGWG